MRVPKRHIHPLLALLLWQFLCWGISGSAVQHRNTPQHDHRDCGYIYTATFRSATERQQSGNLFIACANGQWQFWRPQEAILHLRTYSSCILSEPDVPEVCRWTGRQPSPRPVHFPAQFRLPSSSKPEKGWTKVRGRLIPCGGQEWVWKQLLRVGNI